MRVSGPALVSLLALGACLGREPAGEGLHPEAILFVRADVAGTATATMVVEVTGADITPALLFNIPITNAVASGSITVPAGSGRTFTMRAYDAGGTQTHRGSVTADVSPGVNPTLSIVLTPLAGGVPITGTLGSFSVTIAPATDTLQMGDTVTLRATVRDPSGNTVSGPVVWGSEAPSVATVVSTADQTARVTAVAAGQATIVATYGGTSTLARIVVSAATAPALLQLASGLSAPLYAVAPPGDTARLFIVEQTGRIRVMRHDTLLATPFLDLTGQVRYANEGGLLSLAFHPGYAQNGQFFMDYVGSADSTIHVARYHVSATDANVADPASAQIILSVPHKQYTNHYGGLVVFGPDGYLYVGIGDGGGAGDPSGNGQNTASLLGKILRLDVDGGTPYAIPPTNPFVGQPPALPEIWAYGLRNPWRFSFDPATGDLYIADVGQNAWEEVDVHPGGAAAGQNYGWNVMEGTHCYSPPTGCSTAGLTLPVFEYAHGGSGITGCAVIGGYVYHGARLPVLAGRYLLADLCGGWVRSFKLQNGVAADTVDYTPQFGVHANITSLGRDGRGELYLTTLDGYVYRIVPH